MRKNSIGAGGLARVVDDAAENDSEECSAIRLKTDLGRVRPENDHGPIVTIRRRRVSRPAIRARAERRPHPLRGLLLRLRPARRKQGSCGERIGRRLPWMSLTYLAVAAYGIGAGLHPMAPATVVALASATSAAIVAMMASHRMISAPYAVAFAAITASTYAWAQACVTPGSVSASTFALTALGGLVLFERTAHLAGFLGALAAGFTVALGAAVMPDPTVAGLELLGASIAAMGLTMARSARREAGA